MKVKITEDEYLGFVISILCLVIIGVVFYFGIKSENQEIQRQKQQTQIIYNNGKRAGEKNINILANPYSQERYPKEHVIWLSGYVEGKE